MKARRNRISGWVLLAAGLWAILLSFVAFYQAVIHAYWLMSHCEMWPVSSAGKILPASALLTRPAEECYAPETWTWVFVAGGLAAVGLIAIGLIRVVKDTNRRPTQRTTGEGRRP